MLCRSSSITLALAAALLLQLSATPLFVAAASQVRLLIQNDLSASDLSSALLLQSPQNGTAAISACALYNEQQLSNVNQDIQSELNYLVFRGDLSNSSRIYVGTGSPSSSNLTGGNVTDTRALRIRFNRRQQQQSNTTSAACQAYSVGDGTVSSVDCSTELPILCTNSAPPTTLNSTSPSSSYQVTSSSGNSSFIGYRDSRSFRFLGIPFATPPTGSLRFQPAQPYNGTYTNTSALSYGNACPQTANATEGLPQSVLSEDCLNLNVFSPIIPGNQANETGENGNTTRLLPVAFWIYGGAFTSGASRIPLYDGGNTASRGDVVVVTVNYRLGLLGNLASSTLNGSQGITDQIQALKWVQEHISAFGGDPSQVTIYGESAGAQSVLALMSSTPAKGLFSQAISQSSPWNPFFSRQVYTQGIYPALLNATNCTGTTAMDEAAELTCLQAVDTSLLLDDSQAFSDITAASVAAQELYSAAGVLVSAVEPLLPVVGTGVIDGLPDKLIKSGSLPSAGIPFLIGNMRDEGTLFVTSVPQLANPLPASNTTLQVLLGAAVNDETIEAVNDNASLFGFNMTDPDALRDLVGSIQTQYVWQCPLQQVLGVASQQQTFSSLYSFVFDKGVFIGDAPSSCTPASPSGVDRVCHSEDILEAFGSSNVLGLPYGGQGSYNSLPFNQYVNDVWTAFIRTGNPQPNADYLRARGAAYNSTLAYSQATPFDAFSANSTSAIQLINDPPQHSPLLYLPQCQAFADAGFLYDRVGQNNTGTSASLR